MATQVNARAIVDKGSFMGWWYISSPIYQPMKIKQGLQLLLSQCHRILNIFLKLLN